MAEEKDHPGNPLIARRILQILCGLLTAVGAYAVIILMAIPSDEQHRQILGYSPYRIALLVFLLGCFGVSIFFLKWCSRVDARKIQTILHFLKQPFIKKFTAIFFLFMVTAVWISGFSPSYFLEESHAILERLHPVFVWFFTLSVLLMVFSILVYKDFNPRVSPDDRKTLFVLIITFICTLALTAAIWLVYPSLTNQLWFGRYSAPILATQMFGAWLLVSLLILIPMTFWNKLPIWISIHADLIMFILIWTVAGVVLVNQPIEFMDDLYSTAIEQHIRPLPPNYEIYPRKDSQTYFNLSASIVIGKGIYRSPDKALFLAFQGVNNLLADGSYETMLNIQTIFLAAFPAIVYLLGKKIFHRPAGLLMAALAVLQERNAILLMDEFPVVSAKTLLSEPFMQLWTGIIALTGFAALTDNKENTKRLCLLFGGTLGLSALFRLNTLVLIPFILILIFSHFFREKGQLMQAAGFFLLGVLIALIPWMTHNAVRFGDPFAFIQGKVEGVIFQNRYDKATRQNLDVTSPAAESAAQTDQNPLTDSALVGFFQSGTRSNWTGAGMSSVNISQLANLQDIQKLSRISKSMLRHSLNNVITSFSILPVSIIPQDLFHGSRNQRFWGGYDAGLYEGIQPILIVFHLLVLSIGIASAFRRHRIAGLLPLVVFISYHLSNGLALSSGNRYTQPVSWVIYFYFAAGLIAISLWLFKEREEQAPATSGQPVLQISSRWVSAFLILGILLVGSTPVAADLLPADRFPKLSKRVISETLLGSESCKMAFSDEDLTNLKDISKQEHSFAYFGRILTPIRVNSEMFRLVYGTEGFGGDQEFLTFMFLDPKNKNPQWFIFYPQESDLALRNGMDVMILGVRAEEHEVRLMGIVDSEYSRNVRSYPNLEKVPIRCLLSESLQSGS